MNGINLSNKIAVLPQINIDTGRTTHRQLLDAQADGRKITQRVELVETVQDAVEAELVTKFRGRAQREIDKLCTMPLRNLKTIDAAQLEDFRKVVDQLTSQARQLTSTLQTCAIEVSCALAPIKLDMTPETGALVAAGIVEQLNEIKGRILSPDQNKTPQQRYGHASNAIRAAANLPTYATGVNHAALVAGLQEAAACCKTLLSNEKLDALPALDEAIAMFEPSANTSLNLGSI